MPDIERIDASIAPEEFFKSFVAKRQPVVFKSWLTDGNFHASKWDANYLKQKAGHRELKVEPKSKTSLQFGTSEPRQRMTLSTFLESMDQDLYLTTQYDETSDEDVTTISPPCDLLWDDFPLKPTLMGNLFLQQVNLWLGRSTQGSSSGLHHDSADNLYILLKGRKRFIICPPQHAEQLQPWGDLEEVHENGLISYQSNPTRSDGLSKLHALELKIAALDLKIQQATHPKEAAILEDQKEEAEDELMASQLAGYRDQGDDLDALGMDSDFDEGALGELPVIEDELDDGEEEEEEEEEGAPQAKDDQDQGVKEAPDTFSRFSAAELHASLGLSDSASTLSEDQKKLRDLPFQVIELNAGEMLYLPASWWHDVTSQSDSMHAAFNYWFFPPNTTSFEQPYDDQLVWKHLEHLQATQWREKGYLKRKRSDSGRGGTAAGRPK